MPRLFGTDGVRGVANRDLTPDLALALGRAAGRVLAPGGTVVVGRDTRISGPMLEAALVAGLNSSGVDVRLGGVLPTPAVAFLTVEEGAGAGTVISASHNPVEDNGIKFFSSMGVKIPSGDEEKIERAMEEAPEELPTGLDVGSAHPVPDAGGRYVDHVLRAVEHRLTGLRIVLDCAFGAACRVGPSAFREAGAEVLAIHAEPDGARINVNCGSTSLDALSRKVVAEGADLGLAFDGDADRVLAVDENGNRIDGDQIIALSALRLKQEGALDGDLVVGTVMANLGFIRTLEEAGIEVAVVPVGDRYVAEAMAEHKAVLGGEQSGHIIFGAHGTTGDGILTGLKVAEAVAASGRRLSDLAAVFTPYPQVLVNVPAERKDDLESARGVWDEVGAVESDLGNEGRVLVRASGTEPLVRVMVEADEASRARAAAERIAAAVRRDLTGS